MVVSCNTEHVYPYNWNVVTRAFWNKYPNERLAHVAQIDVLSRYIDTNGCLRTSRLARCNQEKIPKWAESVIGRSAYVYEETICNPKEKTLVLKSINLSFRSIATVEELCTYSVNPADNSSTKYTQETKVTAFVPFISKKLENFSISSGAQTAKKGMRAMEDICKDIFEGTFEPAYCEALSDSKDKNSSG